MSLNDSIHLRALAAARNFKAAEAELIEAISQVELGRVHFERGHPSLFQYVVSELGLTESKAYGLITVSRKAREVPELGRRIQEGSLTVSQARKIVPVLTPTNAGDWLAKAEHMTQRRLEKEVAAVRPETRTPEKARYVTATRVRLELGLSETEMLKLRRVQDLLSQRRGKSASLEETIAALTGEFIARHDPIEKAKRHQIKKGSEAANKAEVRPTKTVKALESIRVRTPIPAAIRHQVNLRDGGRCTWTDALGKRCGQRRWIETHHRRPVCEGGTHALKNLTTLCSAHHSFIHRAPLTVPDRATLESKNGRIPAASGHPIRPTP